MNRWRLMSLAVSTLLLARPAVAQDTTATRDTTRLADITVTATRVPVSTATLSSTVTVLDGATLRDRGVGSIAEALRSVPGLTVVPTGGFGGTTSLFLRGGESDYVKVLVDGVPINDPGGAVDFAFLTTENVERVEVLRGPASVLYGSDATVGVVQIFTRRGAGGPRVSGGVRAGTYGTADVDADLTGSTGTVSYAFGLRRSVSDGIYDLNNDYDNTVLSGRVQLRPDARTDVALSLRYHDGTYHFPTDGSGKVVDANARTRNQVTTVGIDAGRFLTDRIEARVLLASNVTSGGLDDAQDDPADTLGFFAFRSLQDLSRQSVDLRTNVYLDAVTATGGVMFEQQDERTFNESKSAFGPSNGSTTNERSTRAAYGQLLADIGPVSVTLGGRVDDNDTFGTFGTWRVGGAYRFPTGTRIRASAGRSFKAPTFFENFATGFAIGNPDLEPERATVREIGLTQHIADGRLVIDAAWFDQTFRDLIQFSFTDTPNFVNVARADAAGVEVAVQARPVPAVSVDGGFTYLDTEVIDSGVDSGPGATFVEGERLLRRPTTTFHLGVDVTAGSRFQAGARVHYVGSRDDRDFATFPATPVTLGAYATVEASTGIRLVDAAPGRPGVQATLRVENLFDERYVTVQGFPGRGRVVLAGVRVER